MPNMNQRDNGCLRGIALSFATLASVSCVSYISFTPLLESAVGKRLDEVSRPNLEFRQVLHRGGERTTYLFSVDPLWRCKWEFEVSNQTNVVLAWRYPDAESEKWCSALPATRP